MGNDDEQKELAEILHNRVVTTDNVEDSLTEVLNLYVSIYKIILKIKDRKKIVEKHNYYTIDTSKLGLKK